MKTKRVMMILAFAVMGALTMSSCKKATINVNGTTGDGDVTGKGGSTSETFDWTNNQSTAEYNMDITSAAGGSMQLMVEDAGGQTVINQTLTAGQGDDSKSGCSSSGTAGTWKVTITLTDFDGDGSYSLSEGC